MEMTNEQKLALNFIGSGPENQAHVAPPSLTAHLDLILADRRHIWARLEPLRPSRPAYWTGSWTPTELYQIIQEGRWRVHIHPGSIPSRSTPTKNAVIATRWLVVDLDRERGAPPSPTNVLLEIAVRGLPLPTIMYRSKSGGYHLWWRIRRVFFGDPDRCQNREYFVSFYEAVQRRLVFYLRDLGADPAACGLHHQYCIWPVMPLFIRPNSVTSLGTLYRILEEKGPTVNFCRHLNLRYPRRFWRNPVGRRSVKHAPLKWFDRQVFPEGRRNSALLAYLIVAAWADAFPSEEEAVTWAATHCSPPYPEREARAVWRVVAARFFGDAPDPYGISPHKLAELGMPRELIREAMALMGPPTSDSRKERYPLIPPLERLKKPRLLRLIQLLECVASRGIRQASARELSSRSGVPFTTLTVTLAPVVSLWRAARGKNFWDLSKKALRAGLAASRRASLFKCFETQEILIRTLRALWNRTDLDLWRTVRYWVRRDPQLWVRLVVAIRRLKGLLNLCLPSNCVESADFPEGLDEGLRALWIALTASEPSQKDATPYQRGRLPLSVYSN